MNKNRINKLNNKSKEEKMKAVKIFLTFMLLIAPCVFAERVETEKVVVSNDFVVVSNMTAGEVVILNGLNMSGSVVSNVDKVVFSNAVELSSEKAATLVNAPQVFEFTVVFAAGGTEVSSISELPSGWSESHSAGDVTITHTVGKRLNFINFIGTYTGTPDVLKVRNVTSTAPTLEIPSDNLTSKFTVKGMSSGNTGSDTSKLTTKIICYFTP